MDRLRRKSSPSMKAKAESPKKSSPMSTPDPTPWPQKEVDLFQQIDKFRKTTEPNMPAAVRLENVLLEELKFESNVDPAEEAYKTPRKTGGTDPKPPVPGTSSGGKTPELKKDAQGKPSSVSSPTGEMKNGPQDKQNVGNNPPQRKPSAEHTPPGKTPAGDLDKKKGDPTGKKEEGEVETAPNFFINIIITCLAFVIAVTLVTYYLVQDLLPATRMKNFRQHWEHFLTTMMAMPTFIHKLYDELFEPMKRVARQKEVAENPTLNKPKTIIPQDHGI